MLPVSDVQPISAPNLTVFEIEAIDAEINLSDGHPRQDLTPSQRAIVNRLPALFEKARGESLAKLEARAHRAFMDAIGQFSAPVETGRVYSIYASSCATIALGYAMAERGERVALLHPTFDNIHDLLSRHVDVVPLQEPLVTSQAPHDAAAEGATSIFVTTPNNPTGNFIGEDEFRELVQACVEADITLCLDTSFRGFDTRTQFDHYALLEESGVRYVVIEDTGKLWPVLELKLGIIAVSTHWQVEIEHALSDILLSVSPVILALVEQLALDAQRGGFDQMQALVHRNRSAVAAAVSQLEGIDMVDPDSRVSVVRLAFDDPDTASRVHDELRRSGVHVLPCAPFHWSTPQDGAHLLRIALGRDANVIDEAMSRLSSVWARFEAELESVIA